uniref:Ribosomal protein S10 n=1 Tax=Chloropicon primus TaxID=1764295 RepID=A0A4D6C446_9CHLO|nr:ribosomal protein S10 [Chloropicon primus]QBX98465.1 ribosomal protein S10 [Chloropicon primus]
MSSLYQVKLKLTCSDLTLLKRFEEELKPFLDERSSYSFLRMPTRSHLKTVLRSPHVNKKSREHFVLDVHSSVYTIKDPSNYCVKGLLRRLKSWSGGEYVLSFCERYGQRK